MTLNTITESENDSLCFARLLGCRPQPEQVTKYCKHEKDEGKSKVNTAAYGQSCTDTTIAWRGDVSNIGFELPVQLRRALCARVVP